MKLTLSISAVAILVVTVEAQCPFPNYKVGNKCCNLFGKNCAGPCWNMGCETVCQQGKYPGFPESCLGNDRHYACCPKGSGCIPNVPASQACCNQEYKEIFEVSDLIYDFSKATSSIDPQASQLEILFKGTNQGSRPQDIGKVTQTISSSQTTGWTFSSATKMSASTKVKAGIPFVADGAITVGLEETLTYGESGSKTSSIAVSVDTGGNSVAAYSRQMFVFKSTMKVFNVPFTATATMRNQCGSIKKETITGQGRVSGVASFAQGEVSKVIGPAVPIECDSPFNTPIEQQGTTNFCPNSGSPECKFNALCVRYQITGNQGICCDAADTSACCAVAKAHTTCDKFKPEEILCPSKGGRFHPCCIGAAFKIESNITKVGGVPVIAIETLPPHK